MTFAPVKLFHAVVISGAALTSCAGPAKKPITGTINNQSALDSTKAPPPTEAVDDGTCPPDAELSYPPCYLIL